MLEINNVYSGYGDAKILFDINMKIEEGEIVALVGANAAGKTTLINTVSGIVKLEKGEIIFCEESMNQVVAEERVNRGIIQVPEGRRLFPELTVVQNLELGAYNKRARKGYTDTIETVFEILPILKDRGNQLAGTLSGGEQQMCAIGRALMAKPTILMFDEPSLGLAPIMVKKIFEVICNIRNSGTTVLLVEQNVQEALMIADRGYVLENGKVVLDGNATDLLKNDLVRKAYLGL